MDNIIKVGIGILIRDGNKVLLGKRVNKKDTGGIYEPDTWTIPGGKQEFNETMFEGAKREVKEETNLDVDNIVLFGAADDMQTNKHFITLHMIANSYSGELKVMEPEKESEWKWFDLDNLPERLYSPTKKFLDNYIKTMK